MSSQSQIHKKFKNNNFLTQFLTRLEKSDSNETTLDINSQKLKIPETDMISSNQNNADSNTNKLSGIQRGATIKLYDKFKQKQLPAIKRLSSPLFYNNKILTKNSTKTTNNNLFDIVTPKTSSNLLKGNFRREVLSESPRKSKTYENIKAFNTFGIPAVVKATISNGNYSRPPILGKYPRSSKLVNEKENLRSSINLTNKSCHNTISFKFNLIKQHQGENQKLEDNTGNIRIRKQKYNSSKNSVQSVKGGVILDKENLGRNNSREYNHSNILKKKSKNELKIENNTNKYIDNIKGENIYKGIKEYIPKQLSTELKYEYFLDKSSKGAKIPNENKLNLEEILTKKRNSQHVFGNNSDANNKQNAIQNINDIIKEHLSSNLQPNFSEEMKSSQANELDAKSYLSYLSSNILKNNIGNYSEANSISNNYTKLSIASTKENMQDVFIRNKYKLLIENYKK